jgi:hypothetical protein
VRTAPAGPPQRGQHLAAEQLEQRLLALGAVHLQVNSSTFRAESQADTGAGMASEHRAQALLGRPGRAPAFADWFLTLGDLGAVLRLDRRAERVEHHRPQAPRQQF